MDWGHYDQEGAIRQRYLDIDDRIGDVKHQTARNRASVDEFQQMYDISWIYHENGLEGVVLTYPEIKSAIDNKIISDVSLLSTYQEIKSQKRAIDLMRQKAAQEGFVVTADFLVALHAQVTHKPDAATVWRKDIPIHRTYFHEIEPPDSIAVRLQDVLAYLQVGGEPDLHYIELAAKVHHRFMRCFPFADHSGMVGRLLLNFILTRAQALPVIIHASDRQRYYEALRGPERDFCLFIVESLENALHRAMRFFYGLERAAMRGVS